MRIYADNEGGLFGLCMGRADAREPTERDLDALVAAEDAMDAFRREIAQVGKVWRNGEHDAHALLDTVLNAWRCVEIAEAAAGEWRAVL